MNWVFKSASGQGEPGSGKIDTMYIRSIKAVKIKLAFRNVHGVTPEVVLLDSRATENFLDLNVWKSMKIGQFKMERPIPIRNVDGTKNKSGNIEYFCWLLVNLGSEKAKMKFYLTSLGNDRIILGYPFLWYFNPEIDWRTAQLKGRVTIETLKQTAIQRKIEEWTKIDRHCYDPPQFFSSIPIAPATAPPAAPAPAPPPAVQPIPVQPVAPPQPYIRT